MNAFLRSIPRGPALIVSIGAVLLVIDDLLPDGGYIDTDLVALLLCVAIGAAAVYPFAPKRFGTRRVAAMARRAVVGLAAGALSFTLAAIAGEYAVRWVYQDVTTTADDRGYFTRRWYRSGAARENAAGFRDREFTDAKAPGVFRIAVVGDSFTYGNGLDEQLRFSNVMQRDLPAPYEVLNFGLPGSNTPQHVDTIRNHVLRLRPDFILVQWFINDVEGSDPVGRPIYSPLIPVDRLHAWLYTNSAFYSLLNSRWTIFQAQWFMGTYEDFLKRRFGDPNGDGMQRDRAAMLDLVNLCRHSGVDVGFVLFPDSGFDLGPAYPIEFLHIRELEFCATEGLTCVDLRPAFALVADRRKLWVNGLDHHPSARANEIAALEILRTFQPGWVARQPGHQGAFSAIK